MKPKILVSRKISDGAEAILKKEFDVTLNLEDKPYTYEELIKLANEYDGIISSSFDKLDKNFFDNLNGKLKIIGHVGVGYDNIHTQSAKEKNIKVSNTPNVLNDAVAEITILLILASSRRIGEAYNLVKSNTWKDHRPDITKLMVGNEVTGKTLGIIGMGRIGQIVADRARAFKMRIVYYNRNKLSNDLEKDATYYPDLKSMLPNCDYVSLHTPATSETKNIINSESLKLFPKHSVFINTSRGSTVDDDALIEALQNKTIYGAGLDVFNNEPNLDKRYLELENCFVLPHIGSATHETRLAMSMLAVDNIKCFFSQKPLLSEVV
ncbi:D-glycerate dehydrogenase [Candidatus Pelagibacter sp.]|nr:D-glycerate dehydrogenase [Candidatus Pelagibacter sp.]